jgi:TfoX/Sxy family transcriptional regulator of competence genes
MSSKQSTIDFLLEQTRFSGVMSYKKMFGEYALYCDQKVVALVCDDQLYIKPTDAGRTYIGMPEESPAYPGSKLYFHIPGDQWEDPEWLSGLIRTSVEALPTPKKR